MIKASAGPDFSSRTEKRPKIVAQIGGFALAIGIVEIELESNGDEALGGDTS